MKYEIEIEYRTGDSFHTEDTSQSLDGEWEDLSIVEQNIDRIIEHYEWYQDINNNYRRSAKDKPKEKPSFANDEYSLKLLLDNGIEYSIHPFWVGYFEALHEAKIVSKAFKSRKPSW